MTAFLPALIFICFLSVVAGHYIPPLPIMDGARVLLMPVVFFFGALALPFWGMLILATFCGLLWDATTLQVITPMIGETAMMKAVEIIPGWSIILYAVLGAVMNGFQPLYLRGRWEIHTLMSGLFTALIVFTEFIFISVRRAAFYEDAAFLFNATIGWRILGAGVVALILAPFIYWGLSLMAGLVGYDAVEVLKKEEDR